ncbi:hypothetical protein GW7_10275 [Heterocephalus glaber]|uniref:Uncharacterized protein n=1 Tax=Heterocephalus glaber TaxID=10181 RepID=G5B3U9_HETGA|nr:hypothetical protein GW7_10275 [Heterocephalus glaber]
MPHNKQPSCPRRTRVLREPPGSHPRTGKGRSAQKVSSAGFKASTHHSRAPQQKRTQEKGWDPVYAEVPPTHPQPKTELKTGGDEIQMRSQQWLSSNPTGKRGHQGAHVGGHQEGFELSCPKPRAPGSRERAGTGPDSSSGRKHSESLKPRDPDEPDCNHKRCRTRGEALPAPLAARWL